MSSDWFPRIFSTMRVRHSNIHSKKKGIQLGVRVLSYQKRFGFRVEITEYQYCQVSVHYQLVLSRICHTGRYDPNH